MSKVTYGRWLGFTLDTDDFLCDKNAGDMGLNSFIYTYSPTYAHFGSWKKPRYAKIVLAGLY